MQFFLCYDQFTMIRVLFLRLIHYLIALGEFGYSVLQYFYHYDSIISKKQLPPKVEADAKKLRKLPLHVGLVITENEFSLKDLANMIVWSVTMGISYVSVYDVNGEIKRNSQALQSAMEQSKEDMTCAHSSSHEIHIFRHTPQHIETIVVGQGTKKSSVHLLSEEDGCQALVRVARNLSHQVANQQILPSAICPNEVSKFLQETHHFPDPDLLLKFGSTSSFMGYLPWQIRLTEMVSVPSHKGLSYQRFVSSLSCYASTHQRFGK